MANSCFAIGSLVLTPSGFVFPKPIEIFATTPYEESYLCASRPRSGRFIWLVCGSYDVSPIHPVHQPLLGFRIRHGRHSVYTLLLRAADPDTLSYNPILEFNTGEPCAYVQHIA